MGSGPVFLLSPPRSCSSVVAGMLGGHPRVYGFPELRLFIGDTVESVLRLPDEGPVRWTLFARSGLIRAVAQVLFGSQSPRAVGAALAWLEGRAAWAPRQVLDVLLDRVSPLVGLEKSPETTSRAANLRRCLDAYPEARFVHLTRHPVATMASMIGHWQMGPAAGRTVRETALAAARGWFGAHRRICELRDQLPRERFLRVRAEDALADPLAACERFASWLGLPFDPAAAGSMLHPECSPYACVGPPGAPGGGDPRFLRDPRLRLGRPSEPPCIPEEWGIGRVEREAIARLAAHLGYHVAVETAAEAVRP
jgi:hypothetical protein